MIDDLSKELSVFLRTRDLVSCRQSLKRFHDKGGWREDAYSTLEELRSLTGIAEDDVLDLMDLVTGFCSPENRIWSVEPWSGAKIWRSKAAIDLFKVESCDWKNGKLTLLPGIPQSLIKRLGIGDVRQGAEIELCYPDGTHEDTFIDEYFVRLPTALEEGFDVGTLPITICLPKTFSSGNVQKGTIVRLKRN